MTLVHINETTEIPSEILTDILIDGFQDDLPVFIDGYFYSEINMSSVQIIAYIVYKHKNKQPIFISVVSPSYDLIKLFHELKTTNMDEVMEKCVQDGLNYVCHQLTYSIQQEYSK